MMTVGECLTAGCAWLSDAGIPNPQMEARVLLAHVTGQSVATLIAYPERTVDDPGSFNDLVERRRNHEPMAHITGTREFWSLPFRVTRNTLDPRPDSETLVEAVLAYFKCRPAPHNVLDLGTGTGCLLLSILSEFPSATGIGVDVSFPAACVARSNARQLDLETRAAFIAAEWDAALNGQFDLIVTNPPYIRTHDIDGLSLEVSRFEPRQALDGGRDGLDAYRKISNALAHRLTPNGVAFFEFGHDQSADVRQLLVQAGFTTGDVLRDLAGRDRCIACWLES